MHDSATYTDHRLIQNRLSRVLKEMNKTVQEGDILEWCQEVETELCPDVDVMFLYEAWEMTVTNARVLLPCNIYRILDVYTELQDNTSRIPFKKLGRWLSVSPDLEGETIYMDFYGTPIDFEENVPLIIKGHEQACYWYCMYQIFFGDFGQGKITLQFWTTIEKNKENEILAAQRTGVRHRTREDQNNEMKIRFNHIPLPARMRLIGNDFKNTAY